MRRSRRLTVRLLATLAVGLFAALAVGSGLDRMSGAAPAVAPLVPAPLRAQAHRVEARLALARGDRPGALGAAAAAVASDPVIPESTALLAAALVLDGRPAAADRAFRVAARFGWREPLVQRYWFAAARGAGDKARAAERLDALLRADPDQAEAAAMLALMESEPRGQAAMVERMAARPPWLDHYLAVGGQLPDRALANRSATLAALAAGGTRLGCESVRRFVATALERGARGPAEQVWTGHCPEARVAHGLADGGLERLAAGREDPFGWTLQRSGDLSIRWPQDSGADGTGHRLRVRSSAPVSRLVLRQAIGVPPGRYRLRGEGTAGRFAASLGCAGEPPLPGAVEGELAGPGQIIRIGACPRPMLGIWLRPGAGAAEIDSLRLERIG